MKQAMVLLLIMAIGVIGILSSASERPDFSGTWVMDKKASSLVGTQEKREKLHKTDVRMMVQKTEEALFFERQTVMDGQSKIYKFTIFTNGQESIVINQMGQEIKVRYNWQRDRLVGEYETSILLQTQQMVPVTVRQSVYLTPNGKSLVIEIHRKFPKREQTESAIFNRVS